MALMALGSYWLVRNTPTFGPPPTPAAATHEPDYFMRRFAVRNFDAAGRLKSEIFGSEARHYPDTDTLEIDNPRVRAFNERGELTVATARRGLTTGDGSQVQLFGNAVVTREASRDAQGRLQPQMRISGEHLHAFLDTDRLTSEQPVVLQRGEDRFTADRLNYQHGDRVLQLDGRVRGLIAPAGSREPAS
ncbi:LPS export ABC transporter periplasmic protein LptC [Ramlibacter rhizophilus]|uniref:LPS export ABC transporter periplasmic protein LptC n=2 Tax=Ramlibacter rhizophilus TaxID=1781167 RepID=A0A4Z0BH81_9BURK|nr:LPS export ABC transporter periplasmic protein LptC [Ramlibacter rhizophilus]